MCYIFVKLIKKNTRYLFKFAATQILQMRITQKRRDVLKKAESVSPLFPNRKDGAICCFLKSLSSKILSWWDRSVLLATPRRREWGLSSALAAEVCGDRDWISFILELQKIKKRARGLARCRPPHRKWPGEKQPGYLIPARWFDRHVSRDSIAEENVNGQVMQLN